MVLLRAYGMDIYADITEFLQEEAVGQEGSGGKTVITTGGRFGGGHLRTDDNDLGIEISIPASVTIFVGFSIKPFTNWDNADDVVKLKSTSGEHIQLRTVVGSSNLEFRAAGVAKGEITLTNGTWQRVEIRATIDDTTGNATIRLNEVTKITFVGDTQTGADSFVDKVQFDGTTAVPVLDFDDMTINDDQGGVNDDWLGDLRIDTLRPTAETGLQDFVPSSGSDNSAMVDEAPGADDDTTFVSSDTAAEQDLYDNNASEGLAPLVIHGIVVRGKVKKDDSGSRSIKFLANTGTIGVSSAFILTTDYQYADGIFDTDPSTDNAPFTKANVDAIQTGVEVV